MKPKSINLSASSRARASSEDWGGCTRGDEGNSRFHPRSSWGTIARDDGVGNEGFGDASPSIWAAPYNGSL